MLKININSNTDNQQSSPLRPHWGHGTTYILSSTWTTWIQPRGNDHTIPNRATLHKTKHMTSLLQNVNVMEDEERLRNCSTLKEINETWQLSVMCAIGMGPGQKERLPLKTSREHWMKLEYGLNIVLCNNCIILMLSCLSLNILLWPWKKMVSFHRNSSWSWQIMKSPTSGQEIQKKKDSLW